MGTENEAAREEAGQLDEQIREAKAEEGRKWQGRFDKLLEEKKELELKVQENNQSQQEYEKKEAELARRERFMNLGAERGMGLDTVIGIFYAPDEETAVERLDEAIKQEAENLLSEEIAKRFPEKEAPKGGKLNQPQTYNDLLRMSDDQIASMPAWMFDQMMDEGQEKQNSQSRRDMLRQNYSFGGGI